eukprot:3865047-Rhodomonas_salina.1
MAGSVIFPDFSLVCLLVAQTQQYRPQIDHLLACHRHRHILRLSRTERDAVLSLCFPGYWRIVKA